jgi:hypothetical protein
LVQIVVICSDSSVTTPYVTDGISLRRYPRNDVAAGQAGFAIEIINGDDNSIIFERTKNAMYRTVGYGSKLCDSTNLGVTPAGLMVCEAGYRHQNELWNRLELRLESVKNSLKAHRATR